MAICVGVRSSAQCATAAGDCCQVQRGCGGACRARRAGASADGGAGLGHSANGGHSARGDGAPGNAEAGGAGEAEEGWERAVARVQSRLRRDRGGGCTRFVCARFAAQRMRCWWPVGAGVPPTKVEIEVRVETSACDAGLRFELPVGLESGWAIGHRPHAESQRKCIVGCGRTSVDTVARFLLRMPRAVGRRSRRRRVA